MISLAAVKVLAFTVSSLLVSGVAFIHSNLFLGMDRALDCYCSWILRDLNFEEAVDSWNSLQALIRCVGRDFSDSFFISQASGALGLAVILASGAMSTYQNGFKGAVLIEEFILSLPMLFLLLLNFRVFHHGSSLTEKCTQIPAFVNQIPTGTAIDHDRQYLEPGSQFARNPRV